jgi:protein HOOK3
VELQDQILSGDKSYAGRADPLLRSQLDELQSDVQKLEDIIAEKEATITTQERTIGSLNRKVFFCILSILSVVPVD